MPKTAYINARIDKQLKAKAQKVLDKVGMTTTDAVNLLMHQIVLRDGLPFEVRVPNKDTRAAIAELRDGKGERHAESTKDVLSKLITTAE